jgi:hypothetical protein
MDQSIVIQGGHARISENGFNEIISGPLRKKLMDR